MKERKSERVKRNSVSAGLASHDSGNPILRFCAFALWFAGLLVAVTSIGQPRTDGIGPGQTYYPVHNLQDDVQVYDEVARAYVPYIAELHSDQIALSTFVDLESNRHYHLLISTRQDGYLFINAALKRKLPANTWVVMSIDSLFRLYRQPELFLTIYGGPGLAGKQLFIGYPRSATQQMVVLRDDNLSVRPRPVSIYDNFLGVGLVFLLATHAFLYTFFQRAFHRFYNLRDLVSLRAQEESFLINRPLSGTNLLFMLNLSFVLAYLMVFAQSRDLDMLVSRTWLSSRPQASWVFSEFMVLSALTFITLVGKYVLLEVLGGLYKFQAVTTQTHFFKLLQSSMLFFTLLAVILIIVAYNTIGLPWAVGGLVWMLLLFYTARLALLYVVIRNVEPIRNLYLFSYLCIVELIPLIVGFRFVL